MGIWKSVKKCIHHPSIQTVPSVDGMFSAAWDFLAGNEVTGEYLEFGVGSGNSMVFAYKHWRKKMQNAKFQSLQSCRFIGFDSFEGLPEISEPFWAWKKGKYAYTAETVKKRLQKDKVDLSRITLIEGFYDDVCKPPLLEKLGVTQTALVHIDCDLYESTLTSLQFIRDTLQNGTIIMFDDYYYYAADPNKGEARAIKYFLEKNPNISFLDYYNYQALSKSFIVRVDSPSA